jgi:hypothetical protein
MSRSLNELYLSDPFSFACDERRLDVELKALWFLDTEQGADSQVFAKSSRVVCSHARACPALSSGKCPLTRGYGDLLNERKVLVMENETPFSLSFKGQKLFARTQPRIRGGQFIWFGRTTVFGSVDEAQA